MTFPLLEADRPPYAISTDPARLNLTAIHAYLTRSYWSPGVPIEVVATAVERSLCFGLFHGRDQVGFARMVTDGATFAYLCDVYVLEEHRGLALGQWLVEVVLSHPSLQGLRRMVLATRDAHTLYEKYGFRGLAHPERFMELHRPKVYEKANRP
jgi:GNAT superfamily N-acetyltransferase